MKSKKKRTVLIIAAVCLAVAVVFAILLYLDYSNGHEVLRLGQYKGLTVTASGTEAPEDALVREIVGNTRFGRALDKKAEEKYNDSMSYFEKEAEYFQTDLKSHVEKYYGTDLGEFRKTVRKTTEETVKEAAVLHAIAEKEEIELTDDEYEAAIPLLMETHGYTDRSQFLKEIDVTGLRDELLQEKVISFLMEQNTVTGGKTK